MKIANRIDKMIAVEAGVKQVVLKVVRIAQVDSQITGIDDWLD